MRPCMDSMAARASPAVNLSLFLFQSSPWTLPVLVDQRSHGLAELVQGMDGLRFGWKPSCQKRAGAFSQFNGPSRGAAKRAPCRRAQQYHSRGRLLFVLLGFIAPLVVASEGNDPTRRPTHSATCGCWLRRPGVGWIARRVLRFWPYEEQLAPVSVGPGCAI